MANIFAKLNLRGGVSCMPAALLLFLCKNLILWVHIRLEPLTDTTLQNQELANRKINTLYTRTVQTYIFIFTMYDEFDLYVTVPPSDSEQSPGRPAASE